MILLYFYFYDISFRVNLDYYFSPYEKLLNTRWRTLTNRVTKFLPNLRLPGQMHRRRRVTDVALARERNCVGDHRAKSLTPYSRIVVNKRSAERYIIKGVSCAGFPLGGTRGNCFHENAAESFALIQCGGRNRFERIASDGGDGRSR